METDIGLTKSVKILKGVKQGDILSALLFCIVIAAIITKSEEECQSGFSIGGQLLSNLSYADHIALINNKTQDLQQSIDALVQQSADVGLHINVSKTECMSTDSDFILSLTINSKQIKQVNEFIYLGCKLSTLNNGLIAVKHRIGLAWAAFEKNKTLLTSKRTPNRMKKDIYNT